MAETEIHDLIVIGAGPGGYVAAARAGARGLKVLLTEKKDLGGVCLNEGCIPSKTLLHSAKLFRHARDSEAYGVYVENPRFKLADVMKRKAKVVGTLRKGMAYQLKRHKVTVVEGEAAFAEPHSITINDQTYHGKNIIIATGSEAMRLPIPGADQMHVLTSREILELTQLPKSIVIVGGGVIGMEFACFFSSVGVEVTVIELLPEILPFFDPDLATGLRRALPEISCHLGCRAEEIGKNDVTFTKNGKAQKIPAELVLLAVGRRPYTQGLKLEKIGLDAGKTGIKVNELLQTNVPNVYAVGDVNGKSPLAHAASRMGEVAANTITGQRDRMRYHAIPWVVYTFPEVAAVGLTVAQAEEQGREVASFKLPMTANGRYLAEHEQASGFCKVVVDAESRALLGVHVLGSYASELIYGAATMIEAELRVEDIRDIVFPHPTVSESLRDAILELPL